MGTTTWGATWVRGVARIVEGEIALDASTVEEYRLGAAGVLPALLALEDETGVARFASRHGLLRCRGGVLREPLADWWLERDVLRGTLALAYDLHAAARGGGRSVEHVEGGWRETAGAGEADEQLPAARAVVSAMQRGLDRTAVVFGEPGGLALHDGNGEGGPFALSATSATLLGHAYLEAARLVASGEAMGRCPECGVVFEVRHRRQAYCTPQHASRARFRRYRVRHQPQVAPGA